MKMMAAEKTTITLLQKRKQIKNNKNKKRKIMKKIFMPMMVLMVMATAMSFTSCSSDVADAVCDGLTKELIDEPTIRGTWSNYVEENTAELNVRYLQLHRSGDNKTRDFSMAEVQNGKRFFSHGEWTLSKDCKKLTLRFTSGSRANRTVSCDVIESKYGFLSIRFEGKVYRFNEVKSAELDNYSK
jgi:hypothetical protein